MSNQKCSTTLKGNTETPYQTSYPAADLRARVDWVSFSSDDGSAALAG